MGQSTEDGEPLAAPDPGVEWWTTKDVAAYLRVRMATVSTYRTPEGVDLEINAVREDGFPDTTARIVSENARTLKFDQSGFEDR